MPEPAEVSQSPSDVRAGAATASIDGTNATAERNAERKKKRKDKIRSAWISFVGRIVAQFVGAAASIVLGLMFLQKYQATTAKSGSHGGHASAVENAAAPVDPAKERRSDGPISIAVLPFENFSPDPRQESIANGLTEALIAGLSEGTGLRVISRTSSMHYKGLRLPLPQIGRELGVDLIVEGSMVRAGERVRVIVQLIDAGTDEHLWAAPYDLAFRDVITLQRDAGRRIVKDLKVVAARGPEAWRASRVGRDGIAGCGVSGAGRASAKGEERAAGCELKPDDKKPSTPPPSGDYGAPATALTRQP
jgi:TolB-like protein